MLFEERLCRMASSVLLELVQICFPLEYQIRCSATGLFDDLKANIDLYANFFPLLSVIQCFYLYSDTLLYLSVAILLLYFYQ